MDIEQKFSLLFVNDGGLLSNFVSVYMLWALPMMSQEHLLLETGASEPLHVVDEQRVMKKFRADYVRMHYLDVETRICHP